MPVSSNIREKQSEIPSSLESVKNLIIIDKAGIELRLYGLVSV
jgi:hypothetical protein